MGYYQFIHYCVDLANAVNLADHLQYKKVALNQANEWQYQHGQWFAIACSMIGCYCLVNSNSPWLAAFKLVDSLFFNMSGLWILKLCEETHIKILLQFYKSSVEWILQ